MTVLMGLATAPAWAGIARVQSASATGLGSILPSWSVPTTAGNMLVASVSCLGGTGTTITAPAGWTSVLRADNGTTIAAAIYIVTNAASQSGTSSWTCSGSSDGTLSLAEYSGVATSSVPDVTTSGIGTGTAPQTGTALTTQPGELAIAVFANNTSSTASGYSGLFTSVNQPTDASGPITTAATQALMATTGPLAASVTLSGSATWAVALATFKAAAPSTRYWIGATSANFDDDTRWSSTSGGGNDATAPSGTGQTAIFDGNGVGDCVLRGDPNLAGIQMLATPGAGYSGSVRGASGATGSLVGAGLTGDWYTGTSFGFLTTTVLDATVDYPDMVPTATTRTGAGTIFSVRYTGQVKASYSQTYTFYTQSDDGVRLYVNGQLLVDNWTLHSTVENSGTITLTANTWYDVRLEYFQQAGFSVLQLKYQSASETKKIIPSTNLRSTGGSYYQGLSTDWYSGIAFDTYRSNARDTTVDFVDTTTVGTARAGTATMFSARWTGQVLATYGETYTFYTQSDDGVRLYVNGALLIDNWTVHTLIENSGTVALAAGQWYDIRLEYYNSAGTGAMQLTFASPSEAKKIIPLASLRTSAATYVAGLSSDWYAGLAFDTYLATFTDTTIDYADVTATALSRIGRSEYYSVRWSGQVLANYSETYTFYAQSDDRVRVYVNNTLVVNNWVNHSSTENSGTIALTAGQWYDVRVEFAQNAAASVIQLKYQSTSVAKQIVPAINLRKFPADAPTLTLGASGLDQRAGTFEGGSRDITIGGTLALSGGVHQATLGLLNLGSVFTKTGGVFGAGLGRVVMSSTSGQTFTPGGATFHDLYFNDGLVGYWKLDETNFTAASDFSGYGSPGQIAGFPVFPSTGLASLGFTNPVGLTLSGSGQGVTVPHAARLAFSAAQSYTLSAWVNATNLSAVTVQGVVVKARNTTNYYGIYLSASPSARWMAGANGSNVTGSIVTAGWHHVAIVQDGPGNRRDIYVDGVSAGNGPAANGSGIGDLWIGRSYAGETFTGSVDDVRLYNRALPSSELMTLSLGNQPSTGVATQTVSGPLIVSGTLALMSGTFAGSSATTIGCNWSNAGGSYTNTGAVTFNGTTAGCAIQSGGQSFPALTLNGAGGGWTLADRLWVSGGALTLTAGTLNGGTWPARAGTFTSSGTFTPATGTVILDGRSSQTLSVAGFNGLRLEGTTETGLVAYWKLDMGTGTRFADFSGSANAGTLSTGYKWTTAVPTLAFDNPAAVSLNGTNAYGAMGATNLPAANAVQSITAWVKFSSSTASQAIVALTRVGSSEGVELGLGSGNVRVFQYGGANMVTKTAPTDGLWHHVAYTYDGTTERLYVDGGTPATATGVSHQTSTPDASWIGTTNGGIDFFSGQVDDVRVYTAALSATQVAALAAGRYAGTGGLATVTLGANLAASGTFAIDNDNLTTGTRTLTASFATAPAVVSNGTYTVGSAAQTFSGGLTVQPQATVTMASSGGTLTMGATTTLTIDGRLNASNPGVTIQSAGGTGTSYAFKVGSTPTATPTLNITGLAVKNTDGNGMWIDADPGAITTIPRFDNLSFSNGTGNQLLQIYGKSLYLSSNGCTFDAGQAATTTRDVKLTGNGIADGETRAVFGLATCASDRGTCASYKQDDDANGDGVGDDPIGNAAVVEFVRAAESDTAGTIVGLPTAAFDWNTFTYYSTYAAYNTASGTSSVIYVRDATGAAKYSWTSVAGDSIVGTPRWNTAGSTHYLYVATASGKVYRLVDDKVGQTLIADNTGSWAGANNPFDCGCAIVTPLGMDTGNIYWGGTQSGQKLWTLGQASRSQPMGSPLLVTPTITSAAPALWINAATTYLFLGLTGHILQIDVTNQALTADNTNPGSASVRGRIAIGRSGGGTRIFAGDDGATMWAIDPANFIGTNKVWSYHEPAGNPITGSPFVDAPSNTVQYGTQGGTVLVLNSSGTPLAGYPYLPGTASDAINSAVFYSGGILVVGTTTGKLFFLDRNNGSGPALIRAYVFGPTEAISGIAYDASSDRYMVSTSDPTTKDGRLYYFDLVSDPTPGTS